MPDAFNRLPVARLEVKATPSFLEKNSYQRLLPGRFFANLYDIKATTKFGMRTLARRFLIKSAY
jgi:uncharacterized protein (DUF885 family)